MASSETIIDDLDVIAQQWQQKHILDDTNPLLVVGRLLRLSKSLATTVQSYHEQYGLRQGEFDVLAALYRTEGNFSLTPSQLHQSLFISSGTMTSRLQHLEQKKLLKRRHCDDDRRCVHVSLTSSGHKVVEKVLPGYFKLITQMTEGLSTQDQQQLSILLKLWLDSLSCPQD